MKFKEYLARWYICYCFCRRNVLLRIFISLLSVVRNIEERGREVQSWNVFMIVFNGSIEYVVCVCAVSLVGKERSKRMKWSHERVEKVFLQLNVLLRIFISLLSVVRNIEERGREVRSWNVFMIVFNGSIEYVVCVCAVSLVGKERSKRMKWSHERVEKVFLQLNVLLRIFISLLSVVRNIEERGREVQSWNVFMIVFNGSIEYVVCVCAVSLVGKERSKRMKWSHERVEKVFLQLNACAKSVLLF